MSDTPKQTSFEESVVAIDETALDKECIRHPTNVLKFMHRANELTRDVDEIKARLEVEEAQLRKRICDLPGKFGLEKVTEGAITSTILLQESYQALQAKLRQAQFEQRSAQVVVSALEHKKRTLTLLVDLHGMGYFAAPKPSPEGSKKVKEMTRQAVMRRIRDDE